MPALSSPNSQQLRLQRLSASGRHFANFPVRCKCRLLQITADKYRAAASEECPVALELCVCCALGAGFHVANANCALVCVILRRETWTGSPG